MGILDIFRPVKARQMQRYKELGAYRATFTVFGDDIYASDTVRACVRPLVELTSKAEAKCPDEQLERLLNNRPNQYMNGKDFLAKIRLRYEILNTAFIYIERDDRGKVVSLYPIPYSYFDAMEYAGKLFIKFYFSGDAAREIVLPWQDLAVVRKDFYRSDFAGESNAAIVKTLQMLNTTNEGMVNAIKSTANLRGILKSTKAMLSPADVKRQKEDFVHDYLSLENSGGIASLDATQEFTPIDMKPSIATFDQMREIRENVYRYFGVSDDVVMSKMTIEQLETFYRLKIEPFLVALSRELTSKVFIGREQAYEKNRITYISESGQFMTMAQKLEFFNKVVLYGGATIDEFRAMLGMGHIEGGEKPIRRLDADVANTGKPREGNGTAKEVKDNEK